MSRLHLNVGCGSRLLKGFVNVDRVAAPGVDLVHDLDEPWPWEDGAADRVEAKDVFEHVADPVLFMTEAWRVLCPFGTLYIRTPHWQHPDAYTDPTHKRFPTEHTFDYWIEGTLLHRLHNAFYGAVTFTREAMEMDGGSMNIILAKAEGKLTRATDRDPLDQRRNLAPAGQLGPAHHHALADRDPGPDQAPGMVPGSDHLPADLPAHIRAAQRGTGLEHQQRVAS